MKASETQALRVIMTTYNPVSENLNAAEPGSGGEAEGNCVAARRIGVNLSYKSLTSRFIHPISNCSASCYYHF